MTMERIERRLLNFARRQEDFGPDAPAGPVEGGSGSRRKAQGGTLSRKRQRVVAEETQRDPEESSATLISGAEGSADEIDRVVRSKKRQVPNIFTIHPHNQTAARPDFDSFTKTYKSFKEDQKHLIPANNVVEDLIYLGVSEAMSTGAAVSSAMLDWILDTMDPLLIQILGTHIRAELTMFSLLKPTKDHDLEVWMKSFSSYCVNSRVRTLSEYRKAEIEFQGPFARDGPPINNASTTISYFRGAVNGMISIFETYPGLEPFMNNWPDSSIWAFLIDRSMQGNPGIIFQRGTSKDGCDGIIFGKINGRIVPFGALLTAGEPDSLVFALKQILIDLMKLVCYDERYTPELQVVGILNIGLTIQLLTLSPLSGSALVLHRGTLLEIPRSVHQLKQLNDIVRNLTAAQNMVFRCCKLVGEYFELLQDDNRHCVP